MNWTSVKKKVPGPYPVVLVVFKGRGGRDIDRMVWVGYRSDKCPRKGDSRWTDPEGFPLYNVTHWMPFPELPKRN